MDLPDVYIAATQAIIPKKYDPELIADHLYSRDIAGKSVNKMAVRLAGKMGMVQRPSVLDFDAFPKRKIKREEDKAKNWCKELVRRLAEPVGLDAVGFLSISTNSNSAANTMPTLTAQVAGDMGLKLDSLPEYLTYYGCGAGVMALKNARDYVQTHNRPAIVISFDHNTWYCNPILDEEDEHFRANLLANLLFGDGAVGLLLVPDSMKGKVASQPLLRIVDSELGFTPGKSMGMKKGKFIVNKSTQDEVPPVVARRAVLPLLQRRGLAAADIEEWSIHQGGVKILERFGDDDVLGLSRKQLSLSMKCYEQVGNLSTPSCLYVLHNHFHGKGEDGRFGLLLGFGVGYYYGAMLYQRLRSPD